MTIPDLSAEMLEAEQRFWFIQACQLIERTDTTFTGHLRISPEFFVQIFFSERNGRFSLALIGAIGRLYGRDREHGFWHRHPFAQPSIHEPTPEGMSARPIFQFLTEVESILLENELI